MVKWIVGGALVAAILVIAVLGGRGRSHVTASSAAAAEAPCTVVLAPTALPGTVRETSGLAQGPSGVLWTHNDAGGRAELFGFDTSGRQVAHVAVDGTAPVDWEDIEAGPCDGGRCLFIGDIGDNNATRDYITIYRLSEPAARDRVVQATALHARYPHGAQDAEALIAGADGSLYVITKGEHGPVRLYRFPSSDPGQEIRTLEFVRELGPQPARRGDRVTAATSTGDGGTVALRTYDRLYFFDAVPLLAGDTLSAHAEFDLRGLNESQGEGLAIDADGGVWLTTEGESGGEPSLTGLSCPHAG